MLQFIKKFVTQIKINKIRTIPSNYFKGYRRLAKTSNEIDGEHCWNCKRAVAYVTWWCDRAEQGCTWERCYVADELSKVDLMAGHLAYAGWLPLPREEKKECSNSMI